MIAALIRLLALRPLLTLTLFGIPILILIVVGLVTIWALKMFVLIGLPIIVIWWIFRKMKREGDNQA